MTTAVELCNMALSHIRTSSINSLNETSLQAKQCKLWYPRCRDQVLTDAPWNFAHKLKALEILENVDVFGWSIAYKYPSDCLYINHLTPNFALMNGSNSAVSSRIYDLEGLRGNMPRVQYEVFNVDGTKVIASNDSNLRIDYRSKIPNPDLISIDAQEAISYLLASKIAVPIIGVKDGRELRKDNLQLYQSHLNQALINNANEEQHDVPDSESITIRQ